MSCVERASLRESCESVGLCHHSDSSPSDLILGLAVVGIVNRLVLLLSGVRLRRIADCECC